MILSLIFYKYSPILQNRHFSILLWQIYKYIFRPIVSLKRGNALVIRMTTRTAKPIDHKEKDPGEDNLFEDSRIR